ncbi:MAG: hypothetical protein R3Y49_06385 [Rikenellaceae bacterium]
MKRKLLFILPLFMVFLAVQTSNAQQMYDGAYFSTQTADDNWIIQPMDIDFDGEVANFILPNGDNLQAYLMIVSMAEVADLDAAERFMESQIESYDFLQAAERGAIVESDFLDLPSITMEFKTTINGAKFEGDLAAIVVNEVMYFFMLYCDPSYDGSGYIPLLANFEVK